MRPATVHLSIDVDSDPISGSVGPGGEDPKPFCGWIELVEAIELARHRRSGEDGTETGQAHVGGSTGKS